MCVKIWIYLYETIRYMYCEQVLTTLEMTQGRHMYFKQAHLKLTGVLAMKIDNRNH